MISLFKRRYRVKKKGPMYVLQTFSTFRWVDIEAYSNESKANIMCNGMRLQQKGWRLK